MTSGTAKGDIDNAQSSLQNLDKHKNPSLSQPLDLQLVFHNIINSSPDRLMVFDRDGNYLYVNDSVVRLFDAPRQKFIGRHVSNFIDQEEVISWIMPSIQKCADGQNVRYQRWRDDPDGKRCFIDIVYTPYLDSNNRILGVLVRVRDQTQLEVSRLKLQTANEQLNDYLTASSDWQWETDAEHRISQISTGLYDTHGVAPESIHGKRIDTVFVNTDADCEGEDLIAMLDRRELFRLADLEFTADANRHRIQLSGIPLHNHAGEFCGYRGSVVDTSDFHNIKAEATIANRRFLQAIDSFSGSFALFDADDKIVKYNKTYSDLHPVLGDELKPGLSFQRCLKIQLENGLIPSAIGRENEWLEQRIAQFRNPGRPFEIEKNKGQWLKITEQRLEDGGCLKTMEDISEMKLAELRLRESEQRFKDFAETAADWFFETDETNKISYLSDRFEELTGQSSEKSLNAKSEDVFGMNLNEKDRARFLDALSGQKPFSDIELVYQLDARSSAYFALSARPKYSDDGAFLGFRGNARNVTEARELSELLQYQARYDELTGLRNRREFFNQIAGAQKNLRDQGIASVIGFIDLDQFKLVNDTEGHITGDRLLQEISVLFSEQLREQDVLCRLGGDEFGILINDTDLDQGRKMVDKLSEALRQYRFGVADRNYGVTASIGLVEVTADIDQIEELMRRADIACFAAKDLGRNQVRVYEATDEELHHHRQQILHASGIQQAIDSNQFCLYVQPIVSTQDPTETKSHFEVLLRLQNDGNIILPGAFIPVAERFRLMPDIDRWVVENAIQSYASFNRSLECSDKPCVLTINLSGESLTDYSFANWIIELLTEHDIDSDRICFEITETAVVTSFKEATRFVNRLREHGVHFALDDFGSGMSSFAYLKRFPADYLKIDGSLVTDITNDAADRTMVLAINQMAHILGMKTIAEFVERDDQIQTLQEIGIDYIQGYAIGKPTPMPLDLATQTEVAA